MSCHLFRLRRRQALWKSKTLPPTPIPFAIQSNASLEKDHPSSKQHKVASDPIADGLRELIDLLEPHLITDLSDPHLLVDNLEPFPGQMSRLPQKDPVNCLVLNGISLETLKRHSRLIDIALNCQNHAVDELMKTMFSAVYLSPEFNYSAKDIARGQPTDRTFAVRTALRPVYNAVVATEGKFLLDCDLDQDGGEDNE